MTNTTPLSQPESVDMVEAKDSTAPTPPSSLWRDDDPVALTSLSSSRQDEVPAPSSNFQQEDMGLSNRFSTETRFTETSLNPPTSSGTDSSTEYQSVYASLYANSDFKPVESEPAQVSHVETLASAPVTPITPVVEPEPVAPPVEVPEPAPLSQAETDSLTTGQRLRQLREQKHLTIQNVADKLYLDVGVIQALEGDHYEALPPEIFVRGYLRGYAKILEVPANGLLEKYDAHVGRKPPPPITPQAKPKKQATTNDLWVKVLTYTIFVTLMILMVLWGVNHYALLPSSDANNTTTVAGENVELRNGEGEYVPPSEGDDDPKIAGQPVVATQPVVTPPTPPTPPPPPPVDLRAAKIHYTKSGVWTQVHDMKGTKVYEGTPKSGDVIDIKGEPPFKVKFGTNNAGIEIEYKGQKAAADTYPKVKKLITVGEPVPATPPAPPVSPTVHSPVAPPAPAAPTPPTPPTR